MHIHLLKRTKYYLFSIVMTYSVCTPQVFGFFLSGKGHYALRGEMITKPSMSDATGTHQAINQSFSLLGEARFNNRSSFFLEFKLFDNASEAYLGDKVEKSDASSFDSSGNIEHFQNPYHPSYEKFLPKVNQFYIQYAFDYCILEAGRRGRNWGLGILYDDGSKMFSSSSSVFDGISCRVNMQKNQTLGFAVGYDKLSEQRYSTDASGKDSLSSSTKSKNSDLDQFFLAIEYDDALLNENASFNKQIGIYGAMLSSTKVSSNSSGTELKFVDLYLNLFFNSINLISKNEMFMVFGKTGAPGSQALGGALKDENDKMAVNNVDSRLAFATHFEWNLLSSGSYSVPKEFNTGDFQQHSLFFNYVYAPGDSDGYYSRKKDTPAAIDSSKRSQSAKALKLNANYNVALIMFNGKSYDQDLAVDGIFDAKQIVNAQVFSLGYRYKNLKIGNFESRLVYGMLNESLPEEVSNYYKSNVGEKRPFGFYGDDLGLEIDVEYSYPIRNELNCGIALGALFPGKAWQTEENKKAQTSYLVQAFASFNL